MNKKYRRDGGARAPEATFNSEVFDEQMLGIYGYLEWVINHPQESEERKLLEVEGVIHDAIDGMIVDLKKNACWLSPEAITIYALAGIDLLVAHAPDRFAEFSNTVVWAYGRRTMPEVVRLRLVMWRWQTRHATAEMSTPIEEVLPPSAVAAPEDPARPTKKSRRKESVLTVVGDEVPGDKVPVAA